MDLWVVEGRRSAGNTNVSQRRKEATRKEEKRRWRVAVKVQNVRAGKIAVTENTESGICFKWRHIQYICAATDGGKRWEEWLCKGKKTTKKRGRKDNCVGVCKERRQRMVEEKRNCGSCGGITICRTPGVCQISRYVMEKENKEVRGRRSKETIREKVERWWAESTEERRGDKMRCKRKWKNTHSA